MKRRNLLQSILLAPFAAVFGKLPLPKPVKYQMEVYVNGRKEMVRRIEFDGSNRWFQVTITKEHIFTDRTDEMLKRPNVVLLPPGVSMETAQKIIDAT